MAKIIDCNCNCPQQDKLHGKNKRIANETKTKSGDGMVSVRCTICGKEQTVKK